MYVEVVRGIGGIRYVKIIEIAKLRDPRLNFSIREYVIERRRDPLTGRWCRINVERALRERKVDEKEIEECVDKIFKETYNTCVFCRDRVENLTPKFVDNTRIRFGKVIITPNLYPFADTHVIGIIDPDRHEIDVSDICEYLEDIIHSCIEYFKKLGKDYKYHYINMNFLFPAGSSIPHAHIQVFASKYPSTYHYEILRRCRLYYRKFLRNMMLDYVESEIYLKDRLIREIESFTIFAAYSPKSYNEVHIVHRDEVDILNFEDFDIKNLSKSICLVLRGYRYVLGQRSFNFSIYSTSASQNHRYFRLFMRLVTRKEPIPYYTNDIGFIELLHEEPVIVTYPEDTARKLREVEL